MKRKQKRLKRRKQQENVNKAVVRRQAEGKKNENAEHPVRTCNCKGRCKTQDEENDAFGEALFDEYYDQLLSVELDLYDDDSSILQRYNTDSDLEETDRMQYSVDIFIAVKPYAIKQLIGYGKHGVVYKVEKDDKEFVAKLARRQSFTRMTMNEFIKIKNISHENIVQYVEVVKCGYVMEFLPGTLKQTIEVGRMRSCTKLKIVSGLLKGLNYLHGIGIAHLDIKPSNILLDHFNIPKLADFGISKRFLTANGRVIKLYSRCGTLPYMSPELIMFYLRQKRPGVDMIYVDMWACGCTSFELLTKKLPYGCFKFEEIFEKQRLNQLHFPCKIRKLLRTDHDTRDLVSIIKSVLTFEPYLRLTTTSLIQKYFSKT